MGVIKISNKRKRKTVPKTGTSCEHENGSTVEPFWMHFFSFSALAAKDVNILYSVLKLICAAWA